MAALAEYGPYLRVREEVHEHERQKGLKDSSMGGETNRERERQRER
jgi:hypothetical protein